MAEPHLHIFSGLPNNWFVHAMRWVMLGESRGQEGWDRRGCDRRFGVGVFGLEERVGETLTQS